MISSVEFVNRLLCNLSLYFTLYMLMQCETLAEAKESRRMRECDFNAVNSVCDSDSAFESTWTIRNFGERPANFLVEENSYIVPFGILKIDKLLKIVREFLF